MRINRIFSINHLILIPFQAAASVLIGYTAIQYIVNLIQQP